MLSMVAVTSGSCGSDVTSMVATSMAVAAAARHGSRLCGAEAARFTMVPAVSTTRSSSASRALNCGTSESDESFFSGDSRKSRAESTRCFTATSPTSARICCSCGAMDASRRDERAALGMRRAQWHSPRAAMARLRSVTLRAWFFSLSFFLDTSDAKKPFFSGGGRESTARRSMTMSTYSLLVATVLRKRATPARCAARSGSAASSAASMPATTRSRRGFFAKAAPATASSARNRSSRRPPAYEQLGLSGSPLHSDGSARATGSKPRAPEEMDSTHSASGRAATVRETSFVTRSSHSTGDTGGGAPSSCTAPGLQRATTSRSSGSVVSHKSAMGVGTSSRCWCRNGSSRSGAIASIACSVTATPCSARPSLFSAGGSKAALAASSATSVPGGGMFTLTRKST
mmetsp:Transcript_51684/g.159292  ORF Transcript_51684/g.159292 Transcript_51684/m.159292 type:complete len:402 (+) Transcript_51684:1-1206(+)